MLSSSTHPSPWLNKHHVVPLHISSFSVKERQVQWLHFSVHSMAKLTMRLQLLMKLFNTVVGMAGFFMVAYGVWLIKVWQSDIEPYSYHHQTSIPWYLPYVACKKKKNSPQNFYNYFCSCSWKLYRFIHAFIGLGISSCAISCLGHFAAHTADSNLLSYVSFTKKK